jgi:prolipoprotein diacylglyceryl transferase
MLLSAIVWDVDSTIITIGSFELRWYGLCFAAGFLIGYQIMDRVFKFENKPEKDLDSLLLTMILSIVLGARVGHYVFYEGSKFFDAPFGFLWDMLIPPYMGLASHGAAFGVLLGLFIYANRNKQYTYLWLTDRLVITAALGGAFIRFGNLMNSEIVGIPTSVPWAFTFMQNNEFAKIPRHPSQLYESLSCLVLFFILFFLYEKYKAATPRGLLTGIFFAWIFGLRFFYEFLKENQVSFEEGMALNMGQWLSIPLTAFGLFFFFRALKNGKEPIPSN